MYDLVIKNCTAVTMDREKRILKNCLLGIRGERIVILEENPGGEGRKLEAVKEIDGAGYYALPGLVNCHTHVYQSLIEGVGYDMHFNPWNLRYLVPIISKMTPRHARISAALASLEMIKTGTTTFSDHWYLHTDFENIREVARQFDEIGLRSHMVFGFLNESFAGRKSETTEKEVLRNDQILLEKAEEFIKTWQGRNNTTVGLGPGSTEDISRDLFKKIINLARVENVSLVTHIAGWIEIISRSLERYGLRDLEYAHSLGFTGPGSIALHAVWLSEEEIKLAAETGTKIVHNPVANMHLGYGIAPVCEMLSQGVTVGLGTDGAASYTYDMFEVGKTAAMLQKVRKLNAEALTAEKALEMMTLEGARVLGLEREIGSLEVGKRADVILVKTGEPHLLPGGRPAAQLVYSARGSDVETVIVNGKLLMENRKLLTCDEEGILCEAQAAREELFQLGGAATEELLGKPWPSGKASWRMV